MAKVLDLVLNREKVTSTRVGRTKKTIQHYVGQGLFRKAFVYYERTDVSKRELDLLKEANDAGLSVEKPVGFIPIGGSKMYYYSAGIKLIRLLPILSKPIKIKIANQLIDLFANLHGLNISHNHAHVRNIALDKNGKVTLIDFKNARKEFVNWQDPKELVFSFESDYAHIYKVFLNLGFTIEESKQFLKDLIFKYKKVPPEAKDSMYNSMITDLRAFFRRTTNTYLLGTQI